jgi:hypothetical protein
MNSTPAEQLIDGLSEDLQDLLVREAYARKRRDGFAALLAELRAKESGLSQTRPSFLTFRKAAKESFESAGQQLRDEIVATERAVTQCNLVLEKCAKAIAAELEQHCQEHSAAFGNAVAAHKLLPEWEDAVGLYQATLKQFITALGVARNQMSSGYNRTTGGFAQGAKDAFNVALAGAKRVEAELSMPNQIAKRQRELLGVAATPGAPVPANSAALPFLTSPGPVKQVATLSTATLEEAQTRIRGLLEAAEKDFHETVPGLIANLTELRAAHETMRQARITEPLTELRSTADAQVDQAQMEEVWEWMLARFPV